MGGLARDVCSANRDIGENRTKLIESVTRFEAEFSDSHRGDREQVATGFEEGDQPGELRSRIGAGDEFKDGCARGRGGTRRRSGGR